MSLPTTTSSYLVSIVAFAYIYPILSRYRTILGLVLTAADAKKSYPVLTRKGARV